MKGSPHAEGLRKAIGGQLPEKVKGVAVFTNQTCDATQGRQVEEGVRLRTLWGELAYQLGGKALYERVRANDESQRVPQGLFVEILQAASPCLILLDELADYCVGAAAVPVGDTTLADQTISFIQQLTEAVQVIEELIALAAGMRESDRRGEALGLTEEELAFYDALENNDSAVKVLGEPTLREIARELVETVRRNVTIDWTERENVRAHLRRLVRRVLRKHGYPPDKQEQATLTVLEQAELFGAEWAEQAAQAPQAGIAALLPFRRVSPTEDEKYRTCVPLPTLKAAAGAFSESQEVATEDWVVPNTSRRLRPGMFVAQVVGRSMQPRIPDGSWCLFQSPVGGSRQGKVVLVQHRDIHDPETGGSYTVKRYRSRKAADAEGWRHVEIRLEPENPEFAPIVLRESDEGAVRVVAELVEVL